MEYVLHRTCTLPMCIGRGNGIGEFWLYSTAPITNDLLTSNEGTNIKKL